MSETTTKTAPRTRTAKPANSEDAKNAEVLNGVKTTAAKPGQKATPKPAPDKKAEPKPAPEPKVTGHKIWATKEVTPAMVNFTKWIEREYGDLSKIEPARLVMIASKAYRYFQASDLNK